MPEMGAPQDRQIFVRDNFMNLENWRPFFFPKEKKPTAYAVETIDNGKVLKASSDASASGLVMKKSFNVYEYPKVRWRWRIMSVYEKGDVRIKSGDDYPLRIYILFPYDPMQAGALEKLRSELIKSVYGEYPPHSALNYIWANREDERGLIVRNAFDSRAIMIALQAGKRNIGTWQEEQVNIVDDYRKAFGKKPPPLATIGIMNDSDNTKERSTSYLAFIEVSR